MTTWSGAVALVTGASRGIGAAVAAAAAERGARVALLARSADDLESVRGRLAGTAHLVVPADVSDRDAIANALRRIEAELGPIDVLVNNAGIGAYGAIVESDPAVFERMMTVNYLGTVWVTKGVLAGMVQRRRGHIVTVASVAGRMAAPFEAAYSASKYAQVGFTEVLAVEASPFGVGVSLVDPGVVATDFFDARGRPYDRSFPKPISAARVARAVIKSVEGGRAERFVPGGLRIAHAITTLVPPLAYAGKRRTFATELAELVERHPAGATPSASTDDGDTTEGSPR